MKEINEKKESVSSGLRIGLYVLITTVLVILSFVLGLSISCVSGSRLDNKVSEILRKIDKESIYFSSNDDEVLSVITDALLYDDKYSKYYSKEEYEKLKIEDSGNYGGIGITYLVDGDGNAIGGLSIYGVMKNSPAYKLGIKSGDIISAGKTLNGEITNFTSANDIVEYIKRFGLGEEFVLVVSRDNEFTNKEFTLKRENYKVSFVTYYDSETQYGFNYKTSACIGERNDENKMTVLDNKTAYVILEEFSGNCAEEFGKVMSFMKEQGRTKLILDLRNNGGGFLTDLTKIASYLIDNDGARKTLICSSKGNERTDSYYSTVNRFCSNIEEIVVLANGGSASATECLIGAMLCYKDAGFSYDNLILTSFNEERNNYSTFGKGIMQATYNLSFGGALKLTTAKIYWPDETTCIHGVGIVQNNPLNCVSDENAIDRAIELLSD